jgi:hypothetical protein
MKIAVNECYTLLRGDGVRRPDITSYQTRQRDRAHILSGVMRADTPEALNMNPVPADVPFRFAIPRGVSASEFHFTVECPVCNLLRTNQSLMNVDFAPQLPPAPVQAQTNWSGVLALGLLGLAFVGLAISSRN